MEYLTADEANIITQNVRKNNETIEYIIASIKRESDCGQYYSIANIHNEETITKLESLGYQLIKRNDTMYNYKITWSK